MMFLRLFFKTWGAPAPTRPTFVRPSHLDARPGLHLNMGSNFSNYTPNLKLNINFKMRRPSLHPNMGSNYKCISSAWTSSSAYPSTKQCEVI